MTSLLHITASADQFENFFTLPAAVDEIGVLRATPDEVSTTVVDKAKTTFVYVRASPTVFTAYQVDGAERVFGIDLARARDFFARAKKFDKNRAIEMKIDDDNLVKLSCGRLRARFALESTIPPLRRPDHTGWGLKTGMIVSTDELAKAVEAVQALGDKTVDDVGFEVNGGNVKVVSVGQVKAADFDIADVMQDSEVRDNVNVKFSSARLLTLCGALAGQDLQLSIATDRPLYATVDHEGVLHEAFLAPLVDPN